MAFFKKLKDRLFRSSSKLEEGLDAIVEDGGVQEAETEFDASVPDVAEIVEPESPPSEEPAAVKPSSDAPTMNAPVSLLWRRL